MYSLGIILFELYYPFNTEMERITTLSKLKENQIFPQDFDTRVGLEDLDIKDKIKNLLDRNPTNRVESKKLLQEYSDK